MKHVLLGAVLAVAAGCFPDSKCDPDQFLSHDLCIDLPVVGGPDGGAGAGDGASADAAPGATLGQVCATVEECGDDADLCAVIPGQSAGFCTRSGCAADATLCPDGWSCFDASAFVPDLSLCIRN